MTISVIISTYNQPEWLQKCLWGFQHQTDRDFEIIIADDGSTNKTQKVIIDFQQSSGMDIKHVWHEDLGFRKTMILNKAIMASTGDYLIFTDGDCIPRSDFIEVHRINAEHGYFLSGGYVKLNMQVSNTIHEAEIKSGQVFNKNWLMQKGETGHKKLLKLEKFGLKAKLLNFLTPTRATWNGHNASGWKTDISAANGFDERMQYGGEDRELGERLIIAGLKAKQIRFSAVVVHLDHARGYAKPEIIAANNQIRLETKRTKSQYTPYGIIKD